MAWPRWSARVRSQAALRSKRSSPLRVPRRSVLALIGLTSRKSLHDVDLTARLEDIREPLAVPDQAVVNEDVDVLEQGAALIDQVPRQTRPASVQRSDELRDVGRLQRGLAEVRKVAAQVSGELNLGHGDRVR